MSMFDERSLSEQGDPMFKHNFDVMHAGGIGIANDSSQASSMSYKPGGQFNDLTKQNLSYGYSYNLQNSPSQPEQPKTAKVQRGY